MKTSESTFTGYGGLELFCKSWPAEKPRAAVVLVHGFGEHCDRYPHVIETLVPAGYSVFSFDHRGHGRSPGKRGHVLNWNEFLQDIENYIQKVHTEHADLPLYLMGHSMGGLMVLTYALHHPQLLRGVISSAPVLTEPNLNPVLLTISKLLSRLAPGFAIATKLNGDQISRDPDVVAAYKSDPLVHSMASTRLGTEITAAAERAQMAAGQFTLPLLMLNGGADELVPPQGSAEFFEQVPHNNKERHVYEGGFHEPHNDIQHQQVTADILNWLDKQMDEQEAN